MVVALQRDLFALGARLADPSHRIAPRVSKIVDRRRERRRGSRAGSTALEAELPPLRHFILVRRAPPLARPCTLRAPSAAGRSAPTLALGLTRWSRSSSFISIACPTCCSSWRAPPITAPASPKPSGEPTRTRPASRSRAHTTRTFRLRRACYLRRLRPHIAAIYAFARGADDIADEPGRTPDERLALLDEWQEHLHGNRRATMCSSALADTREKFDLADTTCSTIC